ncbi:MAG: MFS transporter [Pseudomonadota bacterium]
MADIDSLKGRIALCTGHIAGMIDLAALPFWVGVLISHYQFSPQQAGGLATLFLIGVVVSSLFWSARFHRVRAAIPVPLGYFLSAICFVLISQNGEYPILAALHAVGGLATGMSLSFTHGTIGRSASPHRLFGIAQISLGASAVVFIGIVPPLIEAQGPPSVFLVISAIMFLAGVVTSVAFPSGGVVSEEAADEEAVASTDPTKGTASTQGKASLRFPSEVWFGIVCISLMSLLQAMLFSFVERMGIEFHGFSAGQIASVLLVTAIVNLVPGFVAMQLQNRLAPPTVMMLGPSLQIGFALLMVSVGLFPAYFIAVAIYPFLIVFTHVFAFGFFAEREPSGRAVAATPAMNMMGSAIGPILGGVLVQQFGYQSLAVGALVVGGTAVVCALQVARRVRGGRAATTA